jgi:proteasome lid subunit RPN8/RPN11
MQYPTGTPQELATMSHITLPRTVVNALLTEAQHSPAKEVCGLISSRNGEPFHVYPVSNASDTPEKLFAMDASGQIDAMRRMREQGEELFGIYHSHPHSPAIPSPEDIERAAYPDALYLIISLNTKGVLEMRGFRLHDNEAEAVELEIQM